MWKVKRRKRKVYSGNPSRTSLTFRHLDCPNLSWRQGTRTSRQSKTKMTLNQCDNGGVPVGPSTTRQGGPRVLRANGKWGWHHQKHLEDSPVEHLLTSPSNLGILEKVGMWSSHPFSFVLIIRESIAAESEVCVCVCVFYDRIFLWQSVFFSRNHQKLNHIVIERSI